MTAKGSRGGRRGGATGGVNPGDIKSTTSLISQREEKPAEVDSTLGVLKAVEDKYGVDLEDVQVAVIGGKGASVLGFYSGGGELAVNSSYFDNAKMTKAYDECVDMGFHPSRGNKSGLEAVVAHEMGHRLTHIAGNNSWDSLDSTATNIIKKAAKNAGYGNATIKFSSKISGYAKDSYAEAVAEAFADVFCNGGSASKESHAVVNELNKYFNVK